MIALEESFHGRTFGSLSVTSDEHYRQPFEPLLPTVTFVPVNDPAALSAADCRRSTLLWRALGDPSILHAFVE